MPTATILKPSYDDTLVHVSAQGVIDIQGVSLSRLSLPALAKRTPRQTAFAVSRLSAAARDYS